MSETAAQTIARLEARVAELEHALVVRTAERDYAAGVIARELSLMEALEDEFVPAEDPGEEHDFA